MSLTKEQGGTRQTRRLKVLVRWLTVMMMLLTQIRDFYVIGTDEAIRLLTNKLVTVRLFGNLVPFG